MKDSEIEEVLPVVNTFVFVISFLLILLTGYITYRLYRNPDFFRIDNRSSIVHVEHSLPRHPTITYRNTFVFKIISSSERSIKCSLTSETDYLMQNFWGITTYNHKELYCKSNEDLKSEMLNNKLLESAYHRDEVICEHPCSEKEIEILIPREFNIMSGLGACIFSAIVLIRDSEDANENNKVVSNIFICILRNQTPKFQIVHQYCKLKNNETLRIKGIYFSAFERDEGDDGTKDVCVVCYTNKPDVVTLPCRHLCMCQSCFSILQHSCPMCRSHVTSYFSTQPSSSVHTPFEDF